MTMLGSPVPKYLFEWRNIVRLILLTALFALVFVNIYNPFDATSWYDVSRFMFFVYSSLVILTGMLVVLLSRVIIHFYTRHRALGVGNYLIWMTAELLSMAILYAVYTIIFKPGTDYIDALTKSLAYTSLVIIIPYALVHLYLAYSHNEQTIKQLEQSIPTETDGKTTVRTYAFTDERGEIQFSVVSTRLLYIESADNYVKICYLNHGKPTYYMLRNSLKNIERTFAGSSLRRCHRSYMVNMDAVSVMSRGTEGVTVDFGVDGITVIPVSVTYTEQITHWFTAH